MRPLFRTLVLTVLFSSVSLSAKTLELVAPSRGASLRGGSFASLEWKADRLPTGSEEWEAFLSIDGGRYYAYRITPHLDIELRRFTFIVPNVNTKNATILIRTGDEEHETHFELPGSFSIVRDVNAGRIPRRHVMQGRAESARDGEPAVLEWADGSRDGSGITLDTTTPTPTQSLEAIHADRESATLLAPDELLVHVPEVATVRQSSLWRVSNAVAPIPACLDLLLVCSRRNI